MFWRHYPILFFFSLSCGGLHRGALHLGLLVKESNKKASVRLSPGTMSSRGGSTGGKLVCDMDEHGDMKVRRSGAMGAAARTG